MNYGGYIIYYIHSLTMSRFLIGLHKILDKNKPNSINCIDNTIIINKYNKDSVRESLQEQYKSGEIHSFIRQLGYYGFKRWSGCNYCNSPNLIHYKHKTNKFNR